MQKDYFKGKKITMLGLGLLGRGVGVAKFLAENGAELIVTDTKDKDALAPSLKKLSTYKNTTFVLGNHRMEDFRGRDIVIKAAGVPLDSPYIKEAKKNNIPVEMDASLFTQLAPEGVTIVGITGTRGKSTVTHLVHEALKENKKRVHLGGNVRGIATLPLLKKVKKGDIVVMELDSWQLQGFADAEVSPHVAVFTTFMSDHLNYYKGNMKQYARDKSAVYASQKKGDVCIWGAQAKKEAAKYVSLSSKGKSITAKALPKNWKLLMLGEHNRYNAGVAKEVLHTLGLSDAAIKKSFAKFPGVPGRLEYVATKQGVTFYNDTTATTPDGAIAALKALAGKKKNIMLLAGGADKGLAYEKFIKEVGKAVKTLILFQGAATEKIEKALPGNRKYDVFVVGGMKESFGIVHAYAEKGDIVLLSPGAASFGIFKNEFDRGDQFVKEVRLCPMLI